MSDALPPVNALLLDDNEGESSSMAELLKSEELDVVPLRPDAGLETTAEQLADQLADDRPNVFLLDYRLDDRQDVDFGGGSVASLLKRPTQTSQSSYLRPTTSSTPGSRRALAWRTSSTSA